MPAFTIAVTLVLKASPMLMSAELSNFAEIQWQIFRVCFLISPAGGPGK